VVLQVLYLVFNEGRSTSAGPGMHRGLAAGLARLGTLDTDTRMATPLDSGNEHPSSVGMLSDALCDDLAVV
jgi:hypothetical protein